MFELMESSGEAISKALDFSRERAPGMAITTSELSHILPYKSYYPCLLDFYITHYLNRDRVMTSSLSYHICEKKIAKFLVYPKTNKITDRYRRWRLIEGGTTLGNFQRIQPMVDGRLGNFQRIQPMVDGRPIVQSDGFQPTLLECLRSKEPFLLHTVTMNDLRGKFWNHQSIVTLELAKALVYHKKNITLMKKLNVDEVLSVLNEFETKNPEAKNSKVILEVRKKILESEGNEIQF